MPTFRYSVEGKTVPSVTTIIHLLGDNKRALIHSAWKLGMDGKNYRDVWGSAAEAGTAAHALAEAHMRGLPEPTLDNLPAEDRAGALERFENFKAWLKQVKYEPVASEVSMVSKMHLFGGTIDAVGLVNGEPALVDLKSKTLYKDQIIQVAAYRNLWNENHPDLKIKSVHILGMKDGFHHHMIPDDHVETGWQAFLSLKDIYGYLKCLPT